MVGAHCTKAWSKTQALVAKSSGESELYGVVRATCEALGTLTLLEDLGRSFAARVHVDASTAKSMCERNGLDRVRHIDVNVLWLQEQQTRMRAPLHKINDKVNAADLESLPAWRRLQSTQIQPEPTPRAWGLAPMRYHVGSTLSPD